MTRDEKRIWAALFVSAFARFEVHHRGARQDTAELAADEADLTIDALRHLRAQGSVTPELEFENPGE